MFALQGCDGEVVRALLDAGADPDLRSKSDMIAYTFTLIFRNESAVEALVAAGYRLPTDSYTSLTTSYADEPEALALIERAKP